MDVSKQDRERRKPHRINEADFIVDYFRCALRSNVLSSIAHYKMYRRLMNEVDKRSLFIAQHRVFLEAHEDFAQLLGAFYERTHSNTPIYRTLAEKKDNPNYSRKLSRFKKSKDLYDWVGLDQKKLVEMATKASGMSLEECREIMPKLGRDIIHSVKDYKRHKMIRQNTYNTSKHGKAILSVKPELLNNLDKVSDEEGLHYLYVQKIKGGEDKLKSDIIPVGVDQFRVLVKGVFHIRTTMSELIYLFIVQEYPPHVGKIQEANDADERIWKEAKELFSETHECGQ